MRVKSCLRSNGRQIVTRFLGAAVTTASTSGPSFKATAQHSVHRSACLLMKRLDEVAIGVGRQRNRAMAEQILDDLRMSARRKQNAGRRVAKIMYRGP